MRGHLLRGEQSLEDEIAKHISDLLRSKAFPRHELSRLAKVRA